jgi:hypothetical protein
MLSTSAQHDPVAVRSRSGNRMRASPSAQHDRHIVGGPRRGARLAFGALTGRLVGLSVEQVMSDRGHIDPAHKTETCYICGQPAGGGEMRDGAHVLCSWGLNDYERRLKQIVKRRGLFPSIEVLNAGRAE